MPIVNGLNYTVGATTKGGDGSALSFTGLDTGSSPSLTVTNTSGNCSSAPFSCSDAVASCPSQSARMRTDNYQTTEQPIVVEEATKVTAFPNPFSDRVKFVVTSAASGRGSLEVFNMLGQKIKSVYQGNIIAGNQTFEMNCRQHNALTSSMFYELVIKELQENYYISTDNKILHQSIKHRLHRQAVLYFKKDPSSKKIESL